MSQYLQARESSIIHDDGSCCFYVQRCRCWRRSRRWLVCCGGYCIDKVCVAEAVISVGQ